MTREINFRAWDIEEQKMYIVDSICIYDKKDEAGQLGEVFKKDRPLDGSLYFGDTYPDCHLMQFTGLYDKNNQPIYESDIVSIGEQDYTYKSIGVVEYEGCGFEIDRTLYGKSHGGHNLWLLRNYLTVIGNQYEHPHLLTDNQGN